MFGDRVCSAPLRPEQLVNVGGGSRSGITGRAVRNGWGCADNIERTVYHALLCFAQQFRATFIRKINLIACRCLTC